MTDSRKTLLPALFAVGTGLAAAPASALELGEISVQSTLGQPLRASIAYALGPNEQLASYCVSLKPGMGDSGLPAVTRAELSVANGVISLTGRMPLREPMMTLRLDVSCPYTPNLSREYLLFINPAASAAASESAVTADAQPAAARPAVSPAAAPAAAARPSPRAVRRAAPPLDGGTRYRVQPGDSLSMIASRIENRPVGLWSAVAQIFDANPDAFIDNDPNRLKAGSWLVIPDFGNGAASFAAAESPAAEPAVAEAPVVEPAATAAIEVPVSTPLLDDTDVLAPAEPAAPVSASEPVAARSEAARDNVVIPDTELEAPAIAATPNGSVASVAPRQSAPDNSMSWLFWLVGGGLAMIAALLLFGRRRPEPETDEVILPAAAPHPMRRHTDTVQTLKVAEQNDDDPVDFDLVDDDPTAENLALDADLLIGTGLSEGTDVEIGQDFGFAQSTSVDHELPEEMSSMSAPTVEEVAILESEILPEHDDDYDMSVIIDARRMPSDDEDTQKNLAILAEDKADEIDDTDSYTVDQEIDFQMLEQDYEDELTATQALNKEIEKAAAELAERMADDADDTTKVLPIASVTELDVTSRLPADDLDDTCETPIANAASDAADQTVEMSPASEDDTVEMPRKSGS